MIDLSRVWKRAFEKKSKYENEWRWMKMNENERTKLLIAEEVYFKR